MTTFSLRNAKLRTGEQLRETIDVDLEPLFLGGQEYAPEPAVVPADFTITKATTGSVFELAFRVSLHGPCVRCLADAELQLPIKGREYHAAKPGDEELRSPYVIGDETVDLSAWARDTIALALPDKILCRPECAGLCPTCGKDLNDEPHVHDEVVPDSRWAALEALRAAADES
jgi:DUF177 domain-containing protein